jgi:hypothetical protein
VPNLVVPAAPTDQSITRPSCTTNSRGSHELDIRNLENAGKCPYKLCEEKFGDKNGTTRNPDVIYYINCAHNNQPHCSQVYLTMEISMYYNGSRYEHYNKTVPAGCMYSETELRKSIPADDGMTPHIVS